MCNKMNENEDENYIVLHQTSDYIVKIESGPTPIYINIDSFCSNGVMNITIKYQNKEYTFSNEKLIAFFESLQ